MSDLQFLTNKNDLADVMWQEQDLPAEGALAADEVLIRIDAFALTANNITYAVAGERMSYWNFFPAEEGWGRIPVWGFGDVVASAHADIRVGERLYGYFPMGSHLLIRAGDVSERQLMDVVAHRVELPPVYNQYMRVSNDPEHDSQGEAAQMLFRPLFMTSFILDDFIDKNDSFGADAVMLTSASSKTSLGLAYLLKQRPDSHVVGITSAGNKSFVESLGWYHEICTYDDIPQLNSDRPSIVVDMAGNGSVLAAIHNHFAENLKYSCLVGATHWEARAGARDMAGPKPELFFAPTHIQNLRQDIGGREMDLAVADSWQSFTSDAAKWITVHPVDGQSAVEKLYQEMLAGKVTPDSGYILSL